MVVGGSILSFPERGPWGAPAYRGNCLGYVHREIFEPLPDEAKPPPSDITLEYVRFCEPACRESDRRLLIC